MKEIFVISYHNFLGHIIYIKHLEHYPTPADIKLYMPEVPEVVKDVSYATVEKRMYGIL